MNPPIAHGVADIAKSLVHIYRAKSDLPRHDAPESGPHCRCEPEIAHIENKDGILWMAIFHAPLLTVDVAFIEMHVRDPKRSKTR